MDPANSTTTDEMHAYMLYEVRMEMIRRRRAEGRPLTLRQKHFLAAPPPPKPHFTTKNNNDQEP